MQKEDTLNDPGKALYFDGWYKTEVEPINFEDLSKTEKLHVNKIIETGAKSALDIGCGAGGILLALQSKGVEKVHGIDASIEAIKLSEARFKEYGNIEGFTGIQGDMLNINTPKTDAVSLHRVLCCYPDYKGLIQKSTENDAKTIVMTYPRNHVINKIFTFLENTLLLIVSILNKRVRGLKGYNHSSTEVRSEMEKKGYELSYTDTTWYWKTEVYRKKT